MFDNIKPIIKDLDKIIVMGVIKGWE